jgi:hypothetical protein
VTPILGNTLPGLAGTAEGEDDNGLPELDTGFLDGLPAMLLLLPADKADVFVGLFGSSSPIGAAFVAGISSHSSPAITRERKKKGQRVVSKRKDSCASAVEIGTGEDLITAVSTSEEGNARRLRPPGVEFPATPAGLEKSLERSYVLVAKQNEIMRE